MKAYPFCFAKPAVKAAGFVRAGGDVKPVMGDTVGQILGADRGGGWQECSKRDSEKLPVPDGVPIPFPGEGFSRTYIFHIFGCWITVSLWHASRGGTGFSETMGLIMCGPAWATFRGGHLQKAPPLGPQRPLPGRSVSVGSPASRGTPFSPGAFGHLIGPALEPHTRVTLLR